MRNDPNSALLWFPKIQAAGLPVPATHFIPYKHAEILSMFDGEVSGEFLRLEEEINTFIERQNASCFIRTDLGSAKHSGVLKVTSHCGPVLFDLLEDQEMKFWMTPHGPKAIMLREWLILDASFKAFRNLPINREFRFFASAEKVLCWHPYWPADALEEHVDEDVYPNWRAELANLQQITDEEVAKLSELAVRAASAQESLAWSVDFAKDTAGQYWLIDMATMQDSFHWAGCPNAHMEESKA